MGIKQTHTYVELEISKAAYDEIAGKLMAAGYQHCFPVGYEHNPGDGPIDMHGLALTPAVAAPPRQTHPLCDCSVGMCTHRPDCRQK